MACFFAFCTLFHLSLTFFDQSFPLSSNIEWQKLSLSSTLNLISCADLENGYIKVSFCKIVNAKGDDIVPF